MDDVNRRQLLFGTTPHRRPVPNSTVNNNNSIPSNPYSNASIKSTPNHQHNSNVQASEREMLEKSNDDKVDNLRGHVGQMRHLAISIGDEVQDQNEMLDTMSGNFGTAGDSVRKTITSIKRLASNSGSLYLCVMFLFAFVFFFLIYFLIR